MKLLIGLALLAALLAGCAEESADVQVEVAAAEPVAQPAAPSWSVVEYMWCDAGPDFSPENYAKLTAAWNAINDQDPTPAAGAFTIAPKVENEFYDGMWANLWLSEADRDAGWVEWTEKHATAFGAEFDSTMVCHPDKRFLFETTQVTAPVQVWDAEQFEASYNFCSFKEGKTVEDGTEAGVSFAQWIADQRTQGRGTSYMSFVYQPLFDPATTEGSVGDYQFVRADYWANAEEKAADMAAWMAEGNAARELSDEIYDCKRVDFDLYPVKTASM
jgi:hypothetical protein